MQGLVTVFGGSGFLGRYAVRALAKEGWRIRVVMRRPHLAPELRVMGDVGQIELVQGNLRHSDSLAEALQGAHAAVNLVGLLFEAGRQRFHALHVEGAAAVAKAAADAGALRFIQVSAIGADANSKAVYARTKAQGEAAVRAAFPMATILRPSVLFAEEDDFFNRFAGMAAIAPALPLIGGGGTQFQPVYAGDVGAAIASTIKMDQTAGRTFELGGPGVYTFKALMEMILRETGHRRLLLPLPFAVAEPMGVVAGLATLFVNQAALDAGSSGTSEDGQCRRRCRPFGAWRAGDTPGVCPANLSLEIPSRRPVCRLGGAPEGGGR